MEKKPEFHAIAFSPVGDAKDPRYVCLKYTSGCTPDDPNYDFERDYLSISGYVPLKYQPIIAAAAELLEALKRIERATISQYLTHADMAVTLQSIARTAIARATGAT